MKHLCLSIFFYLTLTCAHTQSFNRDSLVQSVEKLTVRDREAVVYDQIINQRNVPDHLLDFKEVSFSAAVSNSDSVKVTLFVSPDYLAVGNASSFIRMPITPDQAFQIAEELNCFLPTPYLVDRIHEAANVKASPIPLTEDRESVQTFAIHNDLIDQQIGVKLELVSGIKKDIVNVRERQDKVSLYGWYRVSGKPIQPLYSGHRADYVDYSHGARLIKKIVLIDGVETSYKSLESIGFLEEVFHF